MKSLFDRLLPDAASRLMLNGDRYESVNDYIVPLLKKTNYYHQLTMHQVQLVITFTDSNTYNWNRIDWLYGQKLFAELSTKEALCFGYKNETI